MTIDFSQLTPKTVEFVLARTNESGPFGEDLFFFIVSSDGLFRIASSEATSFFDWLKSFPDVAWENSIEASLSTENRTFILWRREGPPLLSEKRRASLKERLVGLLTRAGINHDDAAVRSKELIDRYQSPIRGYHTLQHISHCLWELDRFPAKDFDRDLVELAIWYHDAIYEPKSKRNEAESAELMKQDLKGCDASKLERVSQMILATAHHLATEPMDKETQVLLDIDLSILGQNPLDYDVYVQGVRHEYRNVSTPIFYYRRKKLLRKMMKSSLYKLDYFRAQYAEAAKSNLSRELSSWKYKWIPV